MDISPISQSAVTGTLLRSRSALPVATKTHDVSNAEHHGHDRHNRFRGSALGAFQQEIRLKLKTEFNFKFSFRQENYAAVQGPPSADDVAAESLQAARQLVDEAPTTSASSLIKLRASITETASYVRNIVGDQESFDDVDSAVAKVDAGIAELEDEVASNLVSTASVLEVETHSKQRTTIRIRTQEGDTVKLSIRLADQLSATDRSNTDGGISTTSTEVSISSRSRVVLDVEGDLNESELAAIQNVFAQAESIANQFFGGDLERALSVAEGFEFDMEQLARVNMRFRLQQESSFSFRETLRTTDIAAEQVSAPIISEPEAVVVVDQNPAIEVVDDVSAPPKTPIDLIPRPIAPPLDNALSDFFESISLFLRSVGDGFSQSSDGESASFHYSTSFKLELLKAVVNTAEPDSSSNVANNVEVLIDRMLEVAKS